MDESILEDIARDLRAPNGGLNPKTKGLRGSSLLEWLQTRGIADDDQEAKAILAQLLSSKYLQTTSAANSRSVRYSWGERTPAEPSKEDVAVSESVESSECGNDTAYSNSKNNSKRSSLVELDDDSSKSSSKKTPRMQSPESNDGKSIEKRIERLINELQLLAPEVRAKLNTSAFSSLMASLLEGSKSLNTPASPHTPTTPLGASRKASQMIKGIDANFSAWTAQLDRIRNAKDIPDKKALLSALKAMKKELQKPLDSDAIKLHADEKLVWTISGVSLTGATGTYQGRVVLTNFRLLVLGGDATVSTSASLAMIWSATKVQKEKEKSGKSSKHKDKTDSGGAERGLRKVEIILKDNRVLYLYFKKDASDELLERLEAYKKAMPMNLWCWSHKLNSDVDGFTLYDFDREYQRLGVPCNEWRVTDLNSEYKFCDTYPSKLAVPASVDDELLKSASAFRSRARIPALAYRHPNGAVLTRSSQPAVGIGMKRSKDDERLLFEIAQTNKANPILPILDSRPKVNAVANTAMGFGWEPISHYPGCTLTFCGIENIHVMRNSYFKARDIITSSSESMNFMAGLNESGWIGHQQLILYWGIKLAEMVHVQNTSALVHCTDGWDRTTQMVSLAALLLDPFYRTLPGFMILIEKDWLSFGHRFAMRHATDGKESSDRAPIFHQFIECIWQLLHIYPTVFEFNEQFLIDILDELYSCRFGTFIFDCERERVEADVKSKTTSLWSYMLPRSKFYRNVFFDSAVSHVLIPPFIQIVRRLSFWDAYYLRHSDPSALTQNVWSLAQKLHDKDKSAATPSPAPSLAPQSRPPPIQVQQVDGRTKSETS